MAIHLREELRNKTKSSAQYLVALGDTNGLDYPVNDGGDIYARYYQINTSSLNVSTLWSRQYDCKSSKDHVISSVLEVNVSSPSIFVMCHLYLLKINVFEGSVTTFTQIQTQSEKVFSIATFNNFFFLLSNDNTQDTSSTLPVITLRTVVSRLILEPEDRFTVPYEPLTRFNDSTSTLLTGASLTLSPGELTLSQWGAGDYLLTLQAQVTTPTSTSNRISLEYITLKYHDDCCRFTYDYSISSPIVIFLIIFHGILPLSFLIWYHISLHPTTGSFLSSLCALWLPIFSQMINLLYLLSVRFYSSSFLMVLVFDLYLIPVLSLFFYEYILHISQNFSSSYDETFLVTVFAPQLPYSFSFPPSILSIRNYFLLLILKFLDIFFFYSMNVRSLLIQRLLPFSKVHSTEEELSIISSVNSWQDYVVILIYLSIRLLRSLSFIFLLCYNVILSFLYGVVEFIFKYLCYHFFLLSYFYAAYSEYTVNNESTFRIGSNYQYLSHTIFISFLQFLIQFLNTCYLGSHFTPFIILCLVTNGTMMLYCFYRYGIKYIVYVICIKPWTSMDWEMNTQKEKRKQGYYRKNQVGVVYIDEEDDDRDIEMEDGED